MIQEIKNKIRERRNFIRVDKNIFNPTKKAFKYPIRIKKVLVAVCLGSVSFILPDGSLGVVLGMCVLSPLGFKHALRNKRECYKDWIVNKYYKARLRF